MSKKRVIPKKPKTTIKETTIDTLSAFIDAIEKKSTDDLILYRGQREDKPLLPKIAAQRMNHRNQKLLEVEQKMLNDFKRMSRGILNLLPEEDNDWVWLSLAQHHGLPTRLLDWTTNPLAALWFSIQKPASKRNDAVVWSLNPDQEDVISYQEAKKLSPFGNKKTKVYFPYHITNRITAQSAVFTVHQFRSRDKDFLPLDRNQTLKPKLHKYIIPSKKFSNIRYRLDRCGINAFSLFPNIDGLCDYLNWINSKLPDAL